MASSAGDEVLLVKEMEAMCLSDEQQDLLYDEIKTSFITRVDAQQLMWYLKIGHANEDEICRIQQTKGRRHAASELLRILKMKFPNWIHQICGALRHSDIAMEDLANDIETKQATIVKSFERTPRQELSKDVPATLQTSTPVTRTGTLQTSTPVTRTGTLQTNTPVTRTGTLQTNTPVSGDTVKETGASTSRRHQKQYKKKVNSETGRTEKQGRELVVGGGEVKREDNALHLACKSGKIDMVKRILSLNTIDKESRGMYGRTPLMKAAWGGHVAVFDYLVNKGCSVTVVDDDNNNILHVAIIGGSVQMVARILSMNVIDIESRGKYGRPPLMYAAEKGHVGVFNYLVNKGCSVTGVDDYNDNILHVACLGGSVQMVGHILSMNVIDIESRGKYGRPPLMYAASKGHVEVFDYLVNKGCSVTVLDDNNNNILHVACFGGSVQIVGHIVSMNAIDIESRGKYGRTPLMKAAWGGHVELFNYLVNKGCSVTGVSDSKENILHVACIGGSVQMVSHILSMNVIDIESRGQYGRTPVMKAACKGHVEVFDYLVNKGCSVTGVDEDGGNVLHLACYFGKTEIMRRLLRMSCVSEMKSQRDKWGDTPVEIAVRRGHTDIVTLFAGSH